MKSKGLLFSAALLAVLGGVIFWSERQKESEEKKGPKDAPPKILSIPLDQMRTVQVQRIGKAQTTLIKSGDRWTMTAPSPFPLDEEAVNSLTTALSSVESDRVVEENVSDLMPYGLANPYLQVTVTKADGKVEKLLVGDDVPTGGSTYVKTKDAPKLYTIAGFVKTSLDKTAQDLRDRRLVIFEQTKITRVQVQVKGQTVEFGKNAESNWQIIKPRPLRADSTVVDELVRKVKDAKMDASLTPDDEKTQAKDFAAGQPVAVVIVSDASGDHRLEIKKKGENAYAKGTSAEGAYKVNAELNSLDKGIDEYRNKKVFEFAWDDPTKVDVGGKLYEKKDAKWTSGGKQMDNESIQKLVDNLRGLQATRFNDNPPANSGEPLYRFTVTSKDGSRVEKVAIYKSGNDYMARREGDPSGYLFELSKFGELETAVKGIKEAAPEKKDDKKGEKKDGKK